VKSAMTLNQFFLQRDIRTEVSESYSILSNGLQVGKLDIHFLPGIITGTLVVFENVTEEMIQELTLMIDEDIVDCFGIDTGNISISIYQGRDMGVYSRKEYQIETKNKRKHDPKNPPSES
tara:strand:+ start:346 stop:705 length:360 start_codon:yes stop_codon:yes gene_type:complete